MADSKITALTALTAADPANDMFPVVDVSDTTMAASGTTKRISINNILACSPSATLASATITGALGAAGLNVTGATIPANGVYLGSANNLSFSAASALGMTLNATGLGIGYVPSGSADKLGSAATLGVVATGSTADLNFRNSSLTAIQRIRYTDGTGVLTIGSATGTSYPVELGGNTTTRAVTIDASSNVGIGVTPITSHSLSCAGPVGISGTTGGTRTSYIANASACSIYYTDGGGSGYFTDFGNLIIQPRTSAARSVVIATGSTTPVERAVVKSTGQVRFVPLAADPAGAESGDVYYNSSSNKLKCYNGTTWNDLF